VDDREFFREMLRPILAAAGYDVIVAQSARAAYALAREGAAFDLVLTDIEMPDMDGYGLAAALREDLRLQVPIIGMDSYVGAGVTQTASAVGIGAVVGKFDRRGLIAALDSALQERPFREQKLEHRVRKEIAA
jgi:two-component system chemotaxis sensor kinase CheA